MCYLSSPLWQSIDKIFGGGDFAALLPMSEAFPLIHRSGKSAKRAKLSAPRWSIKPDELRQLELIFQEVTMPSFALRQALGEQMGVTARQVRTPPARPMSAPPTPLTLGHPSVLTPPHCWPPPWKCRFKCGFAIGASACGSKGSGQMRMAAKRAKARLAAPTSSARPIRNWSW